MGSIELSIDIEVHCVECGTELEVTKNNSCRSTHVGRIYVKRCTCEDRYTD